MINKLLYGAFLVFYFGLKPLQILLTFNPLLYAAKVLTIAPTIWFIYRLVRHIRGVESFFPAGFPGTLPFYGKLGLGFLYLEGILLAGAYAVFLFPEWGPGGMASIIVYGMLTYLILPAVLLIEIAIARSRVGS